MDFLLSSGDWEQSKQLKIRLSIPKFDVSSQMDLLAGLAQLGVTDVADPDKSDFTPLTAEPMDDAVVLSKVKHGVRVAIDEEGLTAAAYTVMATDTSSAMPPDDIMDFVVDRPFLFAVTDNLGLPLFVESSTSRSSSPFPFAPGQTCGIILVNHSPGGSTMTIAEIARRAGVSKAAVSRYLNSGYIVSEKRRPSAASSRRRATCLPTRRRRCARGRPG